MPRPKAQTKPAPLAKGKTQRQPPGRDLSAYQLHVREEYARLKGTRPGMKNTEIFKRAAAKWTKAKARGATRGAMGASYGRVFTDTNLKKFEFPHFFQVSEENNAKLKNLLVEIFKSIYTLVLEIDLIEYRNGENIQVFVSADKATFGIRYYIPYYNDNLYVIVTDQDDVSMYHTRLHNLLFKPSHIAKVLQGMRNMMG